MGLGEGGTSFPLHFFHRPVFVNIAACFHSEETPARDAEHLYHWIGLSVSVWTQSDCGILSSPSCSLRGNLLSIEMTLPQESRVESRRVDQSAATMKRRGSKNSRRSSHVPYAPYAGSICLYVLCNVLQVLRASTSCTSGSSIVKGCAGKGGRTRMESVTTQERTL